MESGPAKLKMKNKKINKSMEEEVCLIGKL